MVIDTSALLAILQNEPECDEFLEAIDEAATRVISVATFVEISMVVESRRGAEGLREMDLLFDRANIQIIDVDLEQGKRARHAFRRFGKGFHPAGLNFGDCFAYALAEVRGEPLLFKGQDFPQTDVMPAVPLL